jgi:hypothetical protein
VSIARQCELLGINAVWVRRPARGRYLAQFDADGQSTSSTTRTPYYAVRQMARYLRRKGYVVGRFHPVRPHVFATSRMLQPRVRRKHSWREETHSGGRKRPIEAAPRHVSPGDVAAEFTSWHQSKPCARRAEALAECKASFPGWKPSDVDQFEARHNPLEDQLDQAASGSFRDMSNGAHLE